MNTRTENMLPVSLMDAPDEALNEKPKRQVVDLATMLLTIGGLSPGQIAKFKARKLADEANARIASDVEARRKFVEAV